MYLFNLLFLIVDKKGFVSTKKTLETAEKVLIIFLDG